MFDRVLVSVVFPEPLAPTTNTPFIIINCQLSQQRIIQMDLLACVLLRNESNRHQLRHAFHLIKHHQPYRINNVSFRDQTAFGQKSIPSIQVENRELYLNYMQEVLKNKEAQLSRAEQDLLARKRAHQQWQSERKLIEPVEMTTLSECLQKKCQLFQELLRKYTQQYPQLKLDQDYMHFLQSIDFLEQACQENYRLFKEELINNHQELMNERQILQQKISKLQELDSYEKYLNQLQHALEEKQFQVIQKQQSLKQNSNSRSQPKNNDMTLDLEIEPLQVQYNTYHEQHNQHNTINSSTSQRKRSRIFDTKLTPKIHNQISAHKDSSKIMQEKSTGDEMGPTIINAPYIIEQFPNHQQTTFNIGIQTSIEDPRIAATQFISTQALYLKFIKLWVKYSQRKSKNVNSQHSLTMTLYRWRINAIYDEGIKTSAKQIIMWPIKLEKLGNLPYFNYSQLTLKKQKYLENFFDFQRRKFQRHKIVTALKSIIKNKNRKERIAVFVSFKKYRQKCMMINYYKTPAASRMIEPNEALRQILVQQTPVHLTQSNIQRENSKFNKNPSGYLEEPLRQSQQSQYSQKSKLSNKQLSQNKSKSSIKDNKQNNINITKLKEYIKEQEEAEAKLAVECVRTQATFKMFGVLKNKTCRLQLNFWMKLLRQDATQRVEILERTVSSHEFKWQLFMAKARLALTSNNNKISHLEQLLSFAGTDK